jgi:hypothetical protein
MPAFRHLTSFQAELVSPNEAEDSVICGVGRGTPECPLTVNELRLARKPGDTVTTASGYEVKVVQDDTGRLLFQSRSLNETATSVNQFVLFIHSRALTPTANYPTIFSRTFCLSLCSIPEEASQNNNTSHCHRPGKHY